MRYGKRLRRYGLNKYYLPIIGAFFATIFTALLFSSHSFALETKNDVNLYLFWGNGCPHCAYAKEVLEPYLSQHTNIGYYKFEVYYDTANQQKMQAVGEALNIDASGVPLIVVGDKPYVGFSDSIGDEIEQRLEYCSLNACPDKVAAIVGVDAPETSNLSSTSSGVDQSTTNDSSAKIIDLPLIGEINVADVSLPILTILIGLIDGFNPCAMWALLFIITLLIGMHDQRRMWLYGITFIGVSAAVYFVFMAAWLNLFLFIGQIQMIRIGIGLLGIGIGVYYLYDWHRNKTGCAVTGNEKRKAVFVKLRRFIKEKNIWLGLGGIALLAAAVNIVELACSAGLPVLYTGILSSAGLASWQYYAYMLLYIAFFMLDDIVVFTIAMVTFRAVGIESKYTRITHLIGGIAVLIIGLLLIFAPQVLMFG